MSLARLAARQKRAQDWSNFIADGGVLSPSLKATTEKTLARYRTLIASCWQAKAVSPEAELELATLERELEFLNDEARISGSGNTHLKKEERRASH